MKRIVLVLLAGALVLSATAALALRQSRAPQPAAAREDKAVVANVESTQAQVPAAAVGSGQAQTPAAESCDKSAILAAIQEGIEIGPPLVWESVTIKQCQKGYARVLAHPGNVPPGQNVESSEQVFLKESGGAWEVITSGTGISCSDGDLLPELAEACEALGT